MIFIYKNIEEYNPNKKQKILIVFHESAKLRALCALCPTCSRVLHALVP